VAHDGKTHNPQYVSATPEAFHSDVTHCFSVNMSSEEEDICVAVAYTGILFEGGVQQTQLRTEDRENGGLGAVAP